MSEAEIKDEDIQQQMKEDMQHGLADRDMGVPCAVNAEAFFQPAAPAARTGEPPGEPE